LGERGISYRPAVAAFGNNVYIAGLNDPTPADDSKGPELNFIASRDNGRSFGNVVNLSKRAEFPTIAAYGSSVYVKWLEIQGTYGPWQIFFSRSVDNGASFDSAFDLSGKIYTQSGSEMAVYGSYVFVTWGEGSNVILRESNDNGATFQSKVNLSNGQALTGPAMYASKEKLYVAWISSNGMSFRTASLPRNIVESTNNDSLSQISIDTISNSTPRWGIDAVTISGKVTNIPSTDKITVDWGDGTLSSGISHLTGLWGPVSHFYNSTHVGANTIAVKLLDVNGIEKATTFHVINVERHATILTLNSTGVQSGSIMITGLLIDADIGEPIGGKTITFNSTAATFPSVVTSPDGSFSSVARSSGDEVVKVQAQFAGDDLYVSSISPTQNYDMLERKSTESIQLSGIVLIDSKGNALSQISIGDQILIQGNLTNKQNKEQPITYIIQIKDTDGNTVFLSWVKAGIQSNQQMNVAVAWTPNTSGDNSMEVFVWESMTNPIPLSAVSRIKLTVT
jgi:hypothetical protein